MIKYQIMWITNRNDTHTHAHTVTCGVWAVGQVAGGVRCLSPRVTVVFVTMVMMWCQREAAAVRESSASSCWAKRPAWNTHTHTSYLWKHIFLWMLIYNFFNNTCRIFHNVIFCKCQTSWNKTEYSSWCFIESDDQ